MDEFYVGDVRGIRSRGSIENETSQRIDLENENWNIISKELVKVKIS